MLTRYNMFHPVTLIPFSSAIEAFIKKAPDPEKMRELMSSAFGSQGPGHRYFNDYFANGGSKTAHPDYGNLQELCQFITQEYAKTDRGVNLVALAIAFGLNKLELVGYASEIEKPRSVSHP